ncbi:MAG: DUF805 domain-containing protein [Bacteroidales bacterium]|nr:DUF805 domain-containing protein [Bacteroidales bacterium]
MKTIRIGRNNDNDIVVSSDRVSRYHADIIVDAGRVTIVDHSANGMLVNGVSLNNSSCIVQIGDPVFLPGYIPLDWQAVKRLALSDLGNEGENNVRPVPVGIQQDEAPAMGFGETLAYFFDHYTDFSGRARRTEYWYMCIWSLIFSPFWFIWAVVAFIPMLALTVRRLHDSGYSGLYLLLNLTVVGSLVVFVFTVLDSERGANKWGQSPKYPNG